jgi:hypothetical protein
MEADGEEGMVRQLGVLPIPKPTELEKSHKASRLYFNKTI